MAALAIYPIFVQYALELVLIGWLLRHGWRVGVAERAGGVPPDAA